jgi:hypothetical protein
MFPEWLPALLPATLAAMLVGAVPCAAQEASTSQGDWFRDHVRLSGEASASMSTLDAEEEGWFNYSDYENSTVRSLRLSLVGEVTVSQHVAVITEIRTQQLEAPEAYALYVRIRPWLSHALDIHAGRVPPTFGSYPRRLYVADNPLIGMPLAFQYLTSNRGDALPATADELARMRSRGWETTYSIGDPTAEPGLPVANALRWDTGVQVRWQHDPVTVYGAITQGTLGDPRLSDDNGGPQLAARVVFAPHPIVTMGASVAAGPYLARALTPVLPGPVGLRSHRQEAYGADVELSRDRWLVRSELVWNRWGQPAYDADPKRDLDATGVMVEARYKLWPGLYAAGRVDRLGFSTIPTDTFGVVTWDADVTRLELGGGWTVHRHVLLKAVWQRNRRDGGRVRASDIGAFQVVTWF